MTTFQIKLNASIYRKNSIYKNKKVVEKVDKNMVVGFIESKMGISYIDSERNYYNEVSKKFNTECDQLQNYLNLYDKSKNGFITTFYQPAHLWGRIMPTNYLSQCIFHRPTRHSFCNDKLIDIDMVNCHPVLICQIAKQNDISLPNLELYASNPIQYRAEVAEYYNCSVETAKKLFIRIIYGGKYTRWVNENELNDTLTPLPFITIMEQELNEFKNRVYDENLHIRDDILKKTPEKWKDCSIEQIKNSVMSFWCQSIERVIQESSIQYLVKEYKLKITNIIPCQDGFMLLKNDYNPDMIEKIQDNVLKEHNINIKFVEKPFNETFEIPISVTNDDNEIEIDDEETFEYIANEFEKTHCKIINKSIFVKTTDNKTVLMSLSNLETAYSHMSYKQVDNFGKLEKYPFIKKWVGHTHNIRRYEDMDVYPNPLKCPSYILNMWSPFACEKLTTPYEKNQEGLNCILNHIKILCDNDEIVYDYFIKWIAQMIQFPEVKTVCITLISAEGSGKGTLMRLIQRMIGNDKYYETSKPSRDVWGEFNAIMKDTFFINLNELSKQEALQAEGVIKTLITDEAMTINQKGISQYSMRSYHRFMATTNTEDPMRTKKGDRRNLIIRSSDEKKGDNEYFDMLNDYLDNMDVIRTCYDYFKSIEGMNNFRDIKLPTTEYQEDMKGMNECFIEQWLKYFVEQNCELENITLASGRVYDAFKSWCELNKVKYDITSVKFAVRLKNLKINGVEKGAHTKRGNTLIFDIVKMKKYFNIGELVECEETDCCLY